MADVGPDLWPIVSSALGGALVGALIGLYLGRRLPRNSSDRTRAPRTRRADDSVWNDPRFWSEEAEQMFSKIRRRARREQLAARLRGNGSCLRSFHDAMGDRLLTRKGRGLQTIPISKIVGSVDKPCSFTESFYPSSDAMRGRWKKSYAVAHGLIGYEPIELYQLGEDYYVLDGHFRVSVTKALGGDTISARVEEWS